MMTTWIVPVGVALAVALGVAADAAAPGRPGAGVVLVVPGSARVLVLGPADRFDPAVQRRLVEAQLRGGPVPLDAVCGAPLALEVVDSADPRVLGLAGPDAGRLSPALTKSVASDAAANGAGREGER